MSAPDFLLRVAGLPVQSALRQRFTRTADWAAGMLAREDRLATLRDRASAALATAIGAHRNDPHVRRRLVDVRRDLFHLKPSFPPDLAAALDAGGRAAVAELLAEVPRHHAELATGEQVLAGELADRRADLRRLVELPELRSGILLGSPTLDRHLPAYLAAGGRIDKRARRIERSVVHYLTRAACKTSPFSTFTVVCPGRFTDRPGVTIALAGTGAGAPKRSVARLNLALLARLSEILLADDEIVLDLQVRVTQGWRREGERIRFVRRDRLPVADADVPRDLDPVRETVFHVTAGPMLTDVLNRLGDGRRLRLGELAEQLGDATTRPPARVAEFLRCLVRAGFLVATDLVIDIHHPDPVAAYRDRLAALDRPWARRLATRLGRVGARVHAYPDGRTDERRGTLATIRAEMSAAYADLGGGDAVPVRTALYEDATIDGAEALAGRALWMGSLLPQLRRLSRVCDLFDLNLPHRLVTKGYFLSRYGPGGRCDDVSSFAHEFQRDYFAAYRLRRVRGRPFDGAPANPELAALDAGRAELARTVGQAWRALPAGAPELCLDPEVLAAAGDRLPDVQKRLAPRSFFLQVTAGPAPLLVINRVYSGLTTTYSRFAHLFPGTGFAAGLRAILARAQPSDAVLAELKGGYDATNLNLHPAVTRYELVCPGEPSFRAADEQISVSDLVVEHDPGEDRLRLVSRRLGVEVIPVYLGFLVPMALPELQQVLLNFSATSMAPLDLWAGVDNPQPDRAVAHYPRIRCGSLVLHRRAWKAHPRSFPRAPRPDRPGHEWFLRWARWRRDNGLPAHVFVAPEPAGPDRRVGDHKPRYVDLDCYFSLQSLDAAARREPGRLVLTEMLPAPEDLTVRDGAASYVSELAVELNDVATEGEDHAGGDHPGGGGPGSGRADRPRLD